MPQVFIGLATRLNSSEHTVAMFTAIRDYMVQKGMNVIRIGASDMFNSNFPYNNGDAIDWFLKNTNFTVINDRHHTINISSLTAAQWATIDADMLADSQRWEAYGDRLMLEAINEYAGTDFKTRMQERITNFRNAGRTNPLIFDKMEQTWSSAYTASPALTDPLGKSFFFGGYHFYFNYWNRTSATTGTNGIITAKNNTGLQMFGTEEGANTNEGSAFTQAQVDDLSFYLQACADAGISNVVWMNHGLANKSYYDSFGLVYPTIAPQPTYTVNVSAGTGGTASPAGTSTVPVGQSFTATATPNTAGGYTFKNWTRNGVIVGTALTYTMTDGQANTTYNIVANFNPPTAQNYTVSTSATTGGTVAPLGTQQVPVGTPFSVTATPLSGFTLANWTRNGSVVGTSLTYSMNDGQANTTYDIIAHFSPIDVSLPYTNTFTDTAGLTAVSGTWSVSPVGTLDGTSTAEALIYMGNLNWTDYQVTSQARVMSDMTNREAGVVFRYKDPNNFYWAGIGVYNRRISVARKLAGVTTELAGIGADTEIVAGTTYEVKILVVGSNIKVYLNGVLELEVTDASFASGAVGFRLWNCHSQFDIITVTAPPAPEKFTLSYSSTPIAVAITANGTPLQSGGTAQYDSGTNVTLTAPAEVTV